MMVTVQMSADEFQEFIAWRKDKEGYDRELEKADRQLLLVLKKVSYTVEPDPKKPGKFKIGDQDHAEELLDMTVEMIRKMEE